MTKEDTFSLHKLSNLGVVASAAVIIGTGAMNGFHSAPKFLQPFAYTFLVSSIIQNASSIRMAFKFRANDIAERNAFINLALASTLLPFFGLWGSSLSAGTIFEDKLFSDIIQLPLEVLFILSCLDGIRAIPHLLETRKMKQELISKEEGGALQSQWGFFAHVSANFYAIPPTLAGFIMAIDPSHDRQWLVQCLTGGTLPFGLDVSQSHWFYDTTIIATCVNFIALAVTLRDKKLISKDAECTSLGVLGVVVVFLVVNWLGCVDIIA